MVSLGQIIASNYIKYDRMTEMVNNVFAGSSATEINLFIDMNSCLKSVYSNTFKPLGVEEPTELAAHFVNMIAHYRRFFIRRYNVHSNVHLVYSNNVNNSNTIFYPEYNLKFRDSVNNNKLKTEMVINNIEILDKICPYFPDTTITTGTFETAVIIYHIINTIRKDNVPNIIISKDMYTTQIPSIDPSSMVFRPKKSGGMDTSYYIQHGGCIQNFIAHNKVNTDCSGINDGLFSFILALSRLPERYIKSLFAIPKAISVVKDIVDKNIIVNGYNTDISLIYENFETPSKVAAINKGIDARFKALDLQYQYAIFLNGPEKYNFKGIQNLYDPRGIQRICAEYFERVPLDLENL